MICFLFNGKNYIAHQTDNEREPEWYQVTGEVHNAHFFPNEKEAYRVLSNLQDLIPGAPKNYKIYCFSSVSVLNYDERAHEVLKHGQFVLLFITTTMLTQYWKVIACYDGDYTVPGFQSEDVSEALKQFNRVTHAFNSGRIYTEIDVMNKLLNIVIDLIR